MVYLIGSLRNPLIPSIGNELRQAGYEVFEDWHAGGKEADDEWMRYERERGRTYVEALQAFNAQHIFHYDRTHLNRATTGVLVHPAGKSAHLELGYLIGQGKRGYILLDGEPERWDVMAAFASAICYTVPELLSHMSNSLSNGFKEHSHFRKAPWNSDL